VRNAEALVGAPIEAGVTVTPSGRGKPHLRGSVRGEVAPPAGGVDIGLGPSDELPPLVEVRGWRLGYVAVTVDELALLLVAPGLFRPRAREVLRRRPRPDAVGAELGERRVRATFDVTWADGSRWELLIDADAYEDARAVVAAVGYVGSNASRPERRIRPSDAGGYERVDRRVDRRVLAADAPGSR
jgi:hypothetical protein